MSHLLDIHGSTSAGHHPVRHDAPTDAGLYRFRCDELPGVTETVRAFRDANGVLSCVMDGIQRPVSVWHAGLTRPRWQAFSEVPLLFSPEMVRAILEGRKTQTRRPVIPGIPADCGPWAAPGIYSPLRVDSKGEEYPAEEAFGVWGEDWDRIAPVRPGDAIWVRETWNIWENCDGEPLRPFDRIPKERGNGLVLYAETGCCDGPWRPSIHMPRWAARSILDVRAVRCERAADISCADAAAEGFVQSPSDRENGRSLADLYASWWAKQYPDREWCWVYDFSLSRP